jgi:hypothetical protein
MAALNAARSLGDEPLTISQRIRAAWVVNACKTVERTLAQTQPAVPDLRLLQKAFSEEERHHGLLIGARGERAGMHELFDALESGDVSLSELAETLVPGGGDPSPSWGERLFGFLLRDRIRGEHPLFLRLMTELVETTAMPFDEQTVPVELVLAKANSLPRSSMCRLLMSGLNNAAQEERRKHACVRAMVTLLAIERYRIERGTWPEKLEQLVPDFLPAVPLDPADGEPLRFRRLPDGVVVYGLGEDVTDDGGNVHCENPTLPGCDLGYRLWDPGKRRQPPRPIPKEDQE